MFVKPGLNCSFYYGNRYDRRIQTWIITVKGKHADHIQKSMELRMLKLDKMCDNLAVREHSLSLSGKVSLCSWSPDWILPNKKMCCSLYYVE